MKRLPVTLSAAALVVSLLGATPLGHAAGRALATIPPLAKRARLANVATNALRLNGHRASPVGGPGTIPVLNAAGKLPASVGAVGPQGPAGPVGPAGPQGAKGDKGDPGAAASKSFALVKPDGSLGAGTGVASTGKDTTAGGYQIKFNSDVTFCAVLATPGLPDHTATAQVNAFGRGGDTVRVVVKDRLGNFVYDTDFSVAAFC